MPAAKSTPVKLTDRFVASAKPPAEGRTYIYDAITPGMALCLTEKGAKSFVLYARFPDEEKGVAVPARRALGTVGAITLAEAREKARGWLAMIERGTDPAGEERRARDQAAGQRRAEAAADEHRRGNTFGAAFEQFLRRPARGTRKLRDVEREMRRELVERWADRPLTEITHRDVEGVIEAIQDRGALYQAHNVYGHCRAFFGWAYRKDKIDRNPMEKLTKGDLLKPKQARQRVLNADEMRAVWIAAGRMEYPGGPFYRLLMLTGCRKNEIAEMSWREVDLDRRLLTIPEERFKSGTVHIIPLVDEAMTILEELPHFVGGDYVFSTTGGRMPINGHSKMKARLDRLVAEELGYEPPGWVVHDVRRSVRTGLAELRVPEHVAELVIGHARRGLPGVYDRHSYVDERRAALQAWSSRLMSIVDPSAVGGNVVLLHAHG